MKRTRTLNNELETYDITAEGAQDETRDGERFLAVVQDNNPGGETFLLSDNDLEVLSEKTSHKIVKLRQWSGNPSLVFAWDMRDDKEVPSSADTFVAIG